MAVGPLIDEPTLDKVTSHVSDALDKGASLTVGGGRLDGDVYDGGLFFAPTVLDGVTDDMLIAREETFGPVAPLLSFSDEKEVIERANASRYGLAAYFYTQDLRRSQRVAEALEYGMIGINDPNPATPSAPFGGMKESGLGREGGEEGIDAFLESKLVSMTL